MDIASQEMICLVPYLSTVMLPVMHKTVLDLQDHWMPKDTRYSPGKKPKSHESVPVCSWEDNRPGQRRIRKSAKRIYFYCIVRIIEYAQG